MKQKTLSVFSAATSKGKVFFISFFFYIFTRFLVTSSHFSHSFFRHIPFGFCVKRCIKRNDMAHGEKSHFKGLLVQLILHEIFSGFKNKIGKHKQEVVVKLSCYVREKVSWRLSYVALYKTPQNLGQHLCFVRAVVSRSDFCVSWTRNKQHQKKRENFSSFH